MKVPDYYRTVAYMAGLLALVLAVQFAIDSHYLHVCVHSFNTATCQKVSLESV